MKDINIKLSRGVVGGERCSTSVEIFSHVNMAQLNMGDSIKLKFPRILQWWIYERTAGPHGPVPRAENF